MAASKTKLELPVHAFQPQYADDETYCNYPGCNQPSGGSVHQLGEVMPVLHLAQFLANELQQSLMVGQLVTPGGVPEPMWYINAAGFELTKIQVGPEGQILDFNFDWISDASQADGYDVVPMLTTIIHWLTAER